MPETLEKLLMNELIPQPEEEQKEKLHTRLWRMITAGKGDKQDGEE